MNTFVILCSAPNPTHIIPLYSLLSTLYSPIPNIVS